MPHDSMRFLLRRLRSGTIAGWIALAIFWSMPNLMAQTLVPVGVSRLNITPTEPVRLAGYVARKAPSGTVARHIFARALAIGSGSETALLITVDTCAIPAVISEEIRRRVSQKTGISPERIATACTHTHSAPHLAGSIPNMFA